jgi:hypothetical protein
MKTSIALIGLLALIGTSVAEVRTWTSAADATKTFQGEMTALNGDSVTIKRPDGQSIKAALSKFSKEDQEFAKAEAEKLKEAKPAAGATPTTATKEVPADSDLATKFKLGSPVEGLTAAKMEDLAGKVVMVEYWGTR